MSTGLAQFLFVGFWVLVWVAFTVPTYRAYRSARKHPYYSLDEHPVHLICAAVWVFVHGLVAAMLVIWALVALARTGWPS